MKRPSAAIVIASTALFFSVTGAGFAAHHYLITSTSQIKPSVINSLRGHMGARGFTGAAGAAGKFSASDLHLVVGPDTILGVFGSGNGVGSSVATCPAGTTIVSGGYTLGTAFAHVGFNAPSGNGWGAIGVNDSATLTSDIQAVAVCAS